MTKENEWWADRDNVALLVEWMLADGYEHWAVAEAVRTPWKCHWEYGKARDERLDRGEQRES